MDIIKFFNDVFKNEKKLSRTTHKLCRNIIQGLDDDSLKKIKFRARLDWYLLEIINNRLYKKDEEIVSSINYNKSWKEYLVDIKDRKLGHIRSAREKLQNVFPHIEWKAQVEILSFFLLNSTKGDRIWALNSLMENWHLFVGKGSKISKRFLDIVFDLWNKHQDKESALFIIKYAEEESISRMEESLSEVIGYQKVAIRLGTNPNYNVNKNLLSDIEWLYVMAKLKRLVDKATCELILNNLLIDSIINNSLPVMQDNDIFSFALDDNVSLALWCLGELGHYDLIIKFYNFDRNIQKHLIKSIPTDFPPEQYWSIMCIEASKYFPSTKEHKQKILDEIIIKYPDLRTLIEKLELEIQ